MTAHTIATIHPAGPARQHHDIDELQVNRDGNGRVGLLLLTHRGPMLLRDKHMLDELAAQLVRLGFGARQQAIEEVGRG